MSPLLADISWPLAVLAVIVAINVVTWPMYRRLVRQSNLAAAQGDHSAALTASMRLRKSWLPAAVIERLVNPGSCETLIAVELHLLGRRHQALDWCQQGLRVARRPRTKAYLNDLAALIWSGLGDIEKCQQHRSALADLLQKHPMPGLEWTPTAMACESNLGRLDIALQIALDESRRKKGHVSHRWLAATASILKDLGRHAEVLRLTGWLLEQDAPESATCLSEAQNPEAALGGAQVRANYLRAIHGASLLFAAESAQKANQWQLSERYLAVAESVGINNTSFLAQMIGLRAICGAHKGDRGAVLAAETAVTELVARHPDHGALQPLVRPMLASAWQMLGEHERTLATLSGVNSAMLAPIDRSRLASVEAISLEALGQTAQAQATREEARRLAPLAYWNQPQGVYESASEPLEWPEAGALPESVRVEAAVEPPADQPGGRAASSLAPIAWVLAILALLPIIGFVAALPLLVLGIVMLFRRQSPPHDHRVGLAAVVIALASLGCTILVGGNYAYSHIMTPKHHQAGPDADLSAAGLLEPDEELLEKASTGEPSTPLAVEADEESPETAGADSRRHADAESENLRQMLNRKPPVWHQGLLLAVIVFSVIFHEIAHAVAAYWSGDPTARDQGRFNLHPRRHLDLFGSFIVPVVMSLMPGGVTIGWAKPVPIRPQRFRHFHRGMVGVSLAGVSLNIMLALAAANILIVLLTVLGWLHPEVVDPWAVFAVNTPIQLAGVPGGALWMLGIEICKVAILINVGLANFNLLPLPPLDGFGVIRGLTPGFLAGLVDKVSGMGMILLLVLLFTRMLDVLLLPGVYVAGALLAVSSMAAQWW